MTTDIITDTDAPLATAVEAEAAKQVRDAFARLQLQAKKIANNGTVDEDDRARLLTEAANVLKGTRQGITPGTTPTLALGAGAPAPASNPADTTTMAALNAMANDLGVADAQTLVANLAAMLSPVLNEADPAVRNARLVGMSRAADGSIPFTPTGDVDHSAAVAVVQAELDAERDPFTVDSPAYKLAAANGQIRTLTDELNDERAKVTERDATITGAKIQWDADMASLKALIDADRSLKGRLARNKAGLRPDVQAALGL